MPGGPVFWRIWWPQTAGRVQGQGLNTNQQWENMRSDGQKKLSFFCGSPQRCCWVL